MGFTVDDLYNHITKQMSAEDALKKLLASSLLSYENLKFDEGKEVHPLHIIAMATLDLGWDVVIESESVSKDVRGLMIGTSEYLEANMFLNERDFEEHNHEEE
jgi:hypothetical protein